MGVAEHSFDAAELLRRAERINWPDKELLEALVHGVVDHSEDTPKLCVVTWPGKGVAEHTAELSDKVDAEVRQGWIRDREGAASVPMVWRGVGVVLKASGKIRLVVNRSDRRTTRVWDGRRFVAVSPNQNTATDEFPDVRWTSIQTVVEASTIVADAARASGRGLFGGTYDLKDWFRQLAVRADERWKGGFQIGGRVVEDLRLQMGGVSAATIAHRLGMLIAVLLLEDLDEGLDELLRNDAHFLLRTSHYVPQPALASCACLPGNKPQLNTCGGAS